ncbi:MAG TPA: hypothetical protein VKC66_23560 [Xanthobacteraceae bacterium]|nr:hypothetical protein [Xanthobacteraceae bacterium]
MIERLLKWRLPVPHLHLDQDRRGQDFRLGSMLLKKGSTEAANTDSC